MSRWRVPIQLVVAAVIVAGAIVAYFQIIPVTTVDENRLSAVVLTNPEIPHISSTSTFAEPTPVTTSDLPSLIQGATVSPGQTGAFTSQWFGLGTSGGSAGIFLELLPNATLAAQAYTEQMDRSLSASALKSESYPLKATFKVPGLAISDAVYYQIPHPAKKNAQGVEVPQPPSPGYTSLFRINRTTVRIDLQGPAATKAGLLKLTAREAALVKAKVPHWKNMSTVEYPIGSTLVLAAVAVALLLLDFLIPKMFDRVEAARLAREEARRRYQLRSRGSKVVRRQRVRR